jgi:glycosyltransferase involved in cell wall biosynthesis
MGGPENFVKRVELELIKYNLPDYKIINPNPNNFSFLKDIERIKVGRLDGAIYYKTTSLNLFNLVNQRRNKKYHFLKYFPDNVTMFANKPLNFYLNRGSRKLLRECDVIVFQSELSRKMHEKFVGETLKDFRVILNGVPTDIFSPNKEPEILAGFPKLVITASFRLHKRLQDAINIVNHLKKKFPSIKLHVIGNMDNLTSEFINRMDVSNCLFHGKVASLRLPNLYRSCDVGLSPSIFDPCPNSVVEMVACGLPVISVLESGASEIIKCDDLIIEENISLDYMELQTGSSLPKVNIYDWSDRILHVIGNKKYYSDRMLQRVEEELDIKLVASKYAEFIRNA